MSEETVPAGSNPIASLIGLVILFLIGWFVYSNWLKADTWTGMYEVPSTMAIQSLEFDSEEACREWLQDNRYTSETAFNFECGKNCDAPEREMAVFKCEESFTL